MHIDRHSPAIAWDLLFPKHLAMLSDSSQQVMLHAISSSSYIWIGDVDGEVFGFWGLIPPTFLSDSAYIWFYHTSAIAQHARVFIRHSREVTAELLGHHPILVGHGRVGDERSLRWLAWCGAKFGAPEAGLIPFEIKAATYG